MGTLPIFIVIAIAGCFFLLYFLYALWRDAYKSREQPLVKIRKLPSRTRGETKLLRLYTTDELTEGKRL